METIDNELIARLYRENGIKINIVRDEDDEAWDLVIRHRGEVIRVENDYMEPEDAMFIRSLAWIPDAIEEAYKLGYKDGANHDKKRR
jgi:hypothetical protein